MQRYEYTFVRIELKLAFPERKPKEDYQKIIKEYAHDGWRLVQVFAPSIGLNRKTNFYELIFERPLIK